MGGTSEWYAEEHGGGSAGPPLVFVHGAGGSRLHWPPNLRRLPRAHTWALDLPGHGKSPPGGEIGIDDFAYGLEGWHARRGLARAVWIGHSMGSAIVLSLALRAPQTVEALILIGSGPRLRVHPSLLERTASAATFDGAVDDILAWSFAPQAAARLTSAARRRMVEAGPDRLHADLAACDAFDVSRRLGEIDVPVLVVVGSGDRMTPPRQSEALCAGLRRARMETIDGAGHMVMQENPTALAAVIQGFVAGLTTEV